MVERSLSMREVLGSMPRYSSGCAFLHPSPLHLLRQSMRQLSSTRCGCDLTTWDGGREQGAAQLARQRICNQQRAAAAVAVAVAAVCRVLRCAGKSEAWVFPSSACLRTSRRGRSGHNCDAAPHVCMHLRAFSRLRPCSCLAWVLVWRSRVAVCAGRCAKHATHAHRAERKSRRQWRIGRDERRGGGRR